MNKSPLRAAEQLRADVQAIWKGGVDAVRSDRLVRENVQESLTGCVRKKRSP
ncbi:MAG: hypothetical protein U0894_10095 [Pirellulales bacterium]